MDKSAVMSGPVDKGREPLTSRIGHEPVSADHANTIALAIEGLRQALPPNDGPTTKN